MTADPERGVVDPVDLIEGMMREQNLARADLLGVFGTRARAAEIFNRRRKLSLRMIRALVADYGLPADQMILDYEVEIANG